MRQPNINNPSMNTRPPPFRELSEHIITYNLNKSLKQQ